VLSLVVRFVTAPHLQKRPADIDDTVVDIIREMARIPAALKAWRAPISELLNDNRLFNCTADAAIKWKPIVKALFDSDKTAFPEVIGLVVSSCCANFSELLYSQDRNGFHKYLH